VGEFILNNIGLVALFVASGAMLFWPEISRMGLGGAQLVTSYRNDHRLLRAAKWTETVLAFDPGSPGIGA